MSRLYSNRDRSYDLGHLPTELLPRDRLAASLDAAQPTDANTAEASSIHDAIPEYRALFAKYLDGTPAVSRAPVPDDPYLRACNLKATAHFLDSTIAGVCSIAASDWLGEESPTHTYAFVFLIEFGREPAAGESGDAWIRGTNAARTDLRCAEAAVVLSGYLRALGWSARGHVAGDSLVAIERLAQRAGVVKAVDGVLAMPFIKSGFRIGVVTTDYVMTTDAPI
ncbi:MAG: Fe-S protein, partial [Burkholderiales bacterium]